jgi:hypothetical protein
MTLAELDHINQLISDRNDILDALGNPSKIDFTDEDAEVFPEVEELLTRTIAVYQEKKRLLLEDKIQEIEATLIEKYNLDLTREAEDSN